MCAGDGVLEDGRFTITGDPVVHIKQVLLADLPSLRVDPLHEGEPFGLSCPSSARKATRISRLALLEPMRPTLRLFSTFARNVCHTGERYGNAMLAG